MTVVCFHHSSSSLHSIYSLTENHLASMLIAGTVLRKCIITLVFSPLLASGIIRHHRISAHHK
jgi:hypothetical protein